MFSVYRSEGEIVHQKRHFPLSSRNWR